MKRPAFQFYPADWRNNAKLRRCSWEARGVWLEVMGLMHDSDSYGVLHWSLKEIAQALGAPIKALKELAEKGVLYGVEKGHCDPMIYTPVSGRRPGPPVELLAAQPGPVWYSPRMVRDEYVRNHKGNSSRFGGGSGDAPQPPPKGGIGEGQGDEPNPAPSPRQGDGSTASPSSSSSTSVANATSVDARQRFEMFEGWQPDEVSLKTHLRIMGVPPTAITPQLVAEFVSYWMTRNFANNHGGWCSALVKRAADLKTHFAGAPINGHATRQSRPAGGGITLSDNVGDDDWSAGLDPL
ncbi:DnaT-like ssDNA-binding domain-containing protein [Pseudomonas knackmussii]|uniref:DnaT-like ssDNA-binding domain-containing protein n=1 Tax=Pseudomonas knackmussii TaxID=65741 RepID=UPI003BC80B25